jgi:hypothetical protein
MAKLKSIERLLNEKFKTAGVKSSCHDANVRGIIAGKLVKDSYMASAEFMYTVTCSKCGKVINSKNIGKLHIRQDGT